MTPIPVGDLDAEELVAATLARSRARRRAERRTLVLRGAVAGGGDALVDEGAGTWWATVVAGLVAELAGLARPLYSPAQICHLDAYPENVFFSAGRLNVLDWENAGPAATVQDLGSTLWDFCRGRHRANASVRRPLSSPRQFHRAAGRFGVRYGHASCRATW